MENETKKPELTVIAASIDDYATIAEALRAVEDQTARAEIELLVVLDFMDRFAAPADFAERHPGARVVEAGRSLLLHEARAIGVANAAADYALLLEDHCLPAPDCLAFVIERVREGRWAVIGPGFESGNRHSALGHAANLLTYGEWMGFDEAEERPFVAGYNSVWRCASLRRLEGGFEQDLAIPSRLQQRLRESGERLFFEPRAVMVHWEASSHRGVCRILFRQGLGMGFVRKGSSASFGASLLASLRLPALVAWRTLRGALTWRRTRTESLRALFALPWLALVWSAGELVGYWTRSADAALGGVSAVERHRQPMIDPQREPIRRPWAEG